MGKFILGTAQLGLNYGINNKNGKPSMQQTANLLKYAYEHNIDCLDTAFAYGDAEARIGEFIKETQTPFKICTKFASYQVDDCINGEAIATQVEESILRLHIDCIYLYYLHSFSNCKNQGIIEQLVKLKTQGKIQLIGVSVYEPFELDYILKCLFDVIDVVQIPFNIFDGDRWMPYFRDSKRIPTKIKIFSRSAYLQGLIFKEKDDPLIEKLKIANIIDFINRLSIEKNITRARLAIDFCRYFDRLNSIIIGCETVDQLEQNVKLFENGIALNDSDMAQILSEMRTINPIAIDPRKWAQV